MIRNSQIFTLIYALWNLISKLITESYSFSIYKRFTHWLGRAIDHSRIMAFLYTSWDQVLMPAKSRFSEVTYKPLVTTGARFRLSHFRGKDEIENSRLLTFIHPRTVIYLLSIIVFLIPFAGTMILAALCLVSLLVYLLILLMGRIKLRKPTLVDFMFILFQLTYVYGMVTSYNRGKAFQILIVFSVFMLIYFAIVDCIRTSKEMDIFINSLLLSGVIVALYGVYQYFTGVEMDRAWVDEESFSGLIRVYSTFGNPNVLGEYLIIIIALGIGMLWKEKHLLKKVIYLGSVGLSIICLMMTSSRGAMLGALLALGLFVLISEKRLIILGVIGLFMLPFILPDSIWLRLASITDLSDSSSVYRISIYQASINMIKTYWTTGIGLDSFNLVYPIYSLSAAYAYHAHNTFLQIFIELGIMGITTFVILLLLFFQKLYSVAHQADRRYKIMLGAIFGGFAGLLIQGIVDHIWFDYPIALLFWMMIGLGMAVAKLGEDLK